MRWRLYWIKLWCALRGHPGFRVGHCCYYCDRCEKADRELRELQK